MCVCMCAVLDGGFLLRHLLGNVVVKGDPAGDN